MAFHVLYFDDVERERDEVAQRLVQTGLLEVIPMSPPTDMDLEQAIALEPELVLVDYELTKPNNGRAAHYNGGTLATCLRERLPDTPIVLLTREDLPIWGTARHIRDTLRIVDDVLFKGSDPFVTARVINSLANGYRMLRASSRDWPSLLSALQANQEDDEPNLLMETDPPKGNDRWWSFRAARWIRDVIVKYPGILYSQERTALLLGIMPEAFNVPEAQQYFVPAQYQGLFAPENGRWWKGRVLALAVDLIHAEGLQGPVNRSFSTAFSKRFGLNLEVARCAVCGSSLVPPDTVCILSGEPVMIECSLPCRQDDRPAVMERDRVSYNTIRRRDDILDLFDIETQKFIEELWSREG